MAKRELSVTLKNLKFMQRAAPKEEKPKKEEETKPDGNFVPPSNVNRKCMVIMEGDPHPGTIRGRMSFQNFNPSIDKLSDEAGNDHEAEASTSSIFRSGRKAERANGVSEHTGMDMDNGDGEDKRKQPEVASQTSHLKKKQKKDPNSMQPSPSENHSSKKQSKRDKLDWNVLMQKKTKGKRQGD